MTGAIEPLCAAVLASETGDFSRREDGKRGVARQNTISRSISVQKRRNAKQGVWAREAQDVVVGDVEIYKGLKK